MDYRAEIQYTMGRKVHIDRYLGVGSAQPVPWFIFIQKNESKSKQNCIHIRKTK